jgi:MarR family transcriptional regulator, lower aerobic nicotinate degradation pathway regulator
MYVSMLVEPAGPTPSGPHSQLHGRPCIVLSVPAKNTDVKRVLDAIRNLVRVLRLSDHDAARFHGISSAQMFVLHHIGQTEGISITELAAATVTDQSSVSVVVKKLETARLVTRRWSADDARRASLRITPKGRRLIDKAPPTAQERLVAAVRSMPAAEQRRLSTMLDLIVSQIGERIAAPPMLFEETRRRKVRSPKE